MYPYVCIIACPEILIVLSNALIVLYQARKNLTANCFLLFIHDTISRSRTPKCLVDQLRQERHHSNMVFMHEIIWSDPLLKVYSLYGSVILSSLGSGAWNRPSWTRKRSWRSRGFTHWDLYNVKTTVPLAHWLWTGVSSNRGGWEQMSLKWPLTSLGVVTGGIELCYLSAPCLRYPTSLSESSCSVFTTSPKTGCQSISISYLSLALTFCLTGIQFVRVFRAQES